MPHPGLIKTELLRPHIDTWLAEFEADHGDDLSPLWVLAFRVWKTTGNVEKMRKIHNGTIEHIEFDLADRIICAMGDATVWYGLGKVVKTVCGFEFRSVYWKTKLSQTPRSPAPKKRCPIKGCSNEVPPNPYRGKDRIYCSQKCAQKAHDRKTVRQTKKANQDECVNGHIRTDTNSYRSKSTGKLICRDCKAMWARKYRAEKKEKV